MLQSFYSARKNNRGFTLIELMIVVAIIGILAAIAVPNFINYRNKSRVASAVSTMEGVRAALSNYAADSVGNVYPNAGAADNITDYASMQTVLNNNGGTLPATPAVVSIVSVTYASADGSNYTIDVVVDVPAGVIGQNLQVTPSGVVKL